MQETAYPRCFNSLDAPRDRFAVDSPLEEAGFEPSVPRDTTKFSTPAHVTAFRAAVSDWQLPEEPFAGAGPMVRIRFPPAKSRLRTRSRFKRPPWC